MAPRVADDPGRSPARRPPSNRTKLLLAPLIALATVEVVGRAFLWVRGRPYSQAQAHAAIRDALDWMREHRPGLAARAGEQGVVRTTPLLHPYFGWEVLGGQERLAEDLAYFKSGADDANFDLLVVGSSVAAGFSNLGQPAFAQRLRGDPRFATRPINVLRYARGAFKQPQQLMVLAYLLSLGFEPDAVVCVDGMNEIAMALTNFKRRTHPVYPGFTQWAPVAQGGGLDDRALEILLELRAHEQRAARLARWVGWTRATYSCVLGTLARARMARIQGQWVQGQERFVDQLASVDSRRAFRGPAFAGDRADALRASVDAWERSVVSMAALCRERSIPFVHVLQPTLYDPGSKPLTAEEEEGANAPLEWIEGAREGYPLLREGCARLRARGIPCVDASHAFETAEETLYIDAAHFNAAGYELFADLVAPVFLEALGPQR